MNRHFLTLGWTSILNPPSVLICCFFASIAATYAQIRTVTQQPYPTEANSVAWITNVPYVNGGGPQQQLDLYIPTERKNMPLVVYVHGGGWEHGDKAGDSLSFNYLQLLWDGYAMASINYRLAPAAIWPTQLQDCKAAIRWLKAHAHQYGYNSKKAACCIPSTRPFAGSAAVRRSTPEQGDVYPDAHDSADLPQRAVLPFVVWQE
jgi:hypothetical protein